MKKVNKSSIPYVIFFKGIENKYFVVESREFLTEENLKKLCWLFGEAEIIQNEYLEGYFIGPRKEMVTPWSTNAVEITQNMSISGIVRIEEFILVPDSNTDFDSMLQAFYSALNQDIFKIDKNPDPIIYVDNISEYNQLEGLALNKDEIEYLEALSEKKNRQLTDSEVYGFAQINSEHCRHKIFNGTFIIDGEEMPGSLFQLIKKTSKENPNRLVSAYKDNCAFIEGPVIEQFAPENQDIPDFFTINDIKTVISLKAETHNFPTTVEPFYGASTGTGGEIRDRMAGGKGSLPIAGTAVYMTSYPRLGSRYEKFAERKWLYQTPEQILIKASNGASDFGNKFGQPLICGSILTFEHFENSKKYGYDKVIMLAGGIGFGKKSDSLKEIPQKGEKIILLGGDNYRIGMGGGAVSSVATGEFDNTIELNAVQRANPEMQKRVINVIRALTESENNPIVSIHDHGAGGHLNCFAELVEETGGTIEINELPVGDSTLSMKEIVGNESQERMGLVLKEKDIGLLTRIAERERSPIYVVGEITGDKNFKFANSKTNETPIDLTTEDLFGEPPKTVINDDSTEYNFEQLKYDENKLHQYLEDVLQLEAVACKDWLTNKVDRSVTGKIAKQQCTGTIQLPLNNVGVVALDYRGTMGIATSIGHAPICGLIDPANGSVLSIAEALTNMIWAPLDGSLKGVSLSANWMWPAKNKGEDARLYKAVEAVSDFACKLGINVPTGKDSLSMTQKYDDGNVVFAPGTVIISTVGEVTDIKKVISPGIVHDPESFLIYIDFSCADFNLGGSSFSQAMNKLGVSTPTVNNVDYFSKVFDSIQKLIVEEKILAGHDISAGGMITTLLEMCFPNNTSGLDLDLSDLNEKDIVKLLFSENPGIIIQIKDFDYIEEFFQKTEIRFNVIGRPGSSRILHIKNNDDNYSFDIDQLRDIWYRTSYLFDRKQCGEKLAKERFENYKTQELKFRFNDNFTGKAQQFNIDLDRRTKTGIRAAIIREKGVNGDREMAYSLYLAGFDVKDVHMTDLISGRENLEDINMIVFVGGFSNSDVLGSAKGWAGAFLYNEKARIALDNFYKRTDTLSLGICNGCQLMIELGLISKDQIDKPKMLFNDSKKFESGFINVDILDNNSVMLASLAGSRLGIWVAHGEGKFHLPKSEDQYQIPVKFSYDKYPANPNGSDFSTAALCSDDGRHLAMMPHLERSFYPWQWAYYPKDRKNDEITPWVEAYVNAREWIKKKI